MKTKAQKSSSYETANDDMKSLTATGSYPLSKINFEVRRKKQFLTPENWENSWP